MGLDTTHGCWHGAYSSFSEFRVRVAEAAGWPIEEVTTAFGSFLDNPVLPYGELTEENYQGEWPDGVPGDDPLLVLFAHSDCDGRIHPEHGRHLAKRLRELIPRMAPFTQEQAELFAAGLELAAERYEDVEFW